MLKKTDEILQHEATALNPVQ